MKHIIQFLCLAVLLLSTVSCGTTGNTSKLLNTSSSARGSASLYVTPVCVDLQVSGKKISFFMPVMDNVRAGGENNIIDTAVKEALEQNGNADVMVALQTQLKYNDRGQVESVVVSGYPANYINFRSAPEEIQKNMQVKESSASGRPSLLGKSSVNK